MIRTMLRSTRPTARQMYLDPRTKILLCITVSTVVLSGGDSGAMAYLQRCLAAVPLVFLLLLKKPLLAAYYGGMYVFCATVPTLLLPHLPAAVNLLFTGVIAMFTKILPGMSMFLFLVLTTTVSEFVAAMDALRLPKAFTVPVSVMFRFFPTIGEEYAAIRDAMRLRNVGSLRAPMEMLEYRLVPLLMGIVSIGNDLSASALTRGLNAPRRRTNLCPIGFHWQDGAAALFCLTALGMLAFSALAQ